MDRQTKHSPPLGQRRPAFPLRGKWGDFADYRKCVPSMNYCYFFFLMEIKIIHEVCKTNKDKSTEKISPPLLLKPPYIYMRKCNAESQKRSTKGSNFKEDDSVLCPSRSYYSMPSPL